MFISNIEQANREINKLKNKLKCCRCNCTQINTVQLGLSSPIVNDIIDTNCVVGFNATIFGGTVTILDVNSGALTTMTDFLNEINTTYVGFVKFSFNESTQTITAKFSLCGDIVLGDTSTCDR